MELSAIYSLDLLSLLISNMSMFGIEFAPLWIPLERRLQTLAVLQWTFSFLFLGLFCLAFMVYLLFTPLYALPLLYAVWYVYDFKTIESGGRRWESVRRWKIWEYYRDFFPIRLVKTVDLDPKRNYIFGVHPHGIMADGPFCHFATEATNFSEKFPGIKPFLLTIKYQFLFPLHREYFMTTGACSCSKASIDHILTKEGTGVAAVLIVGGAFESLEARPGSLTLNLSRRKGFIRMAIEHGASLVPVFSFGENEIFNQASNPPGSLLRRIQMGTAHWLGFASPVFFGRGVFNYSFGLLPHRRPIVTVVGSPIDVPKDPNPSEESVNKLHQEYVSRLEELFEKHKADCGLTPDKHLHIL